MLQQPVQTTATMPDVLLYSHDRTESLRRLDQIQKAGFSARHVSSFEKVIGFLTQQPVSVCLVDTSADHSSVLELYHSILSNGLQTQLVYVQPTEQQSHLQTFPAAKYELLEANCSDCQLRHVLFSATERAQLALENQQLKQRLREQCLDSLISHSAVMQNFKTQMTQAADSQDILLLQGETGTSLRQAARVLHQMSPQHASECLILECRLLPPEQIEASLLSASHSELNRPETVILHEFHLLDSRQQSRIWQLMELQIRHTGIPQSEEKPRFILTQNIPRKDLLKIATPGETSSEPSRTPQLVTTLELPPLRERKADMSALVGMILQTVAEKSGQPICSVTLEAMETIENHDWPGNENELENALEEAAALTEEGKITGSLLTPWMSSENNSDFTSGLTLKEMERKLIEATFNRYNGNREQTAQALQIGLRTLSGKLRDYGYPPRGGPGSNKPRLRRHG